MLNKTTSLCLFIIAAMLMLTSVQAQTTAGGSYSQGSQAHKAATDAEPTNQAQVNENKTQSLATTARSAQYSEPTPNKNVSGLAAQKEAAVARPNPGISSQGISNPDISNQGTGYSIYSAQVDLLKDINGNGFHQEFRVTFDADTTAFSSDVYARLYLSYEGSPYYLYYQTPMFIIDGSAVDDEYSVRTALNTGYPTGYYDIAIDLYDSYGYLVASTDASNNANLYARPLEDANHESGFNQQGFAAVQLHDDLDGDGFYHSFSLLIDIDQPHGTAAYARVFTRKGNGPWLFEHRTANFTILANTNSDQVTVNGDWQSGYSSGYYDFKINVYDSANQLLMTLGAGNGLLNDLPLEDANSDTYYNHPHPPPAPMPPHSDSHGYGGGASFWILGIASLGLLFRNKRRN